MKNICILGSRGMVGSMLTTYLTNNTNYKIINIPKEIVDATNINWQNSLNDYITLNKDDIIINCIGIIPQKVKNNILNEDIYKRVNSIFPHEVADYCNINKYKCIHISTNCIFDIGPSNELKPPDATDIYGISKANGEPIGESLILRMSIIGSEPYGPKCSLLEWFLKQNIPVNGYKNHIWNGITTLELAKYIVHIIQTNQLEYNIRHLYSSDNITKYDLLLLISKIFNKTLEINMFYTDENVNTTLSSLNTPIITKTIEEQLIELELFIQ